MSERAFSVKEFYQHAALMEWFSVHSDARKLSIDGWYYAVDDMDVTGGPFFVLHARHRDGREHEFREGIYTRAIDGLPWNTTFDWTIQHHLSELYPDEVSAPELDRWHHVAESWEPKQHLDYALQALLDGDMKRYDKSLRAAAVAMGGKVGV